MLGLNSFDTTEVVIGGIELEAKLKKGQFKTGKLGGRTGTMPEIWLAELAGAWVMGVETKQFPSLRPFEG